MGRQAKALLKVPDRNERGEIEGLKVEIERLRNKQLVRDGRSKMALDRLKKKLSVIEQACTVHRPRHASRRC